MSRTAVAAPPDPFDELFMFIDKMTLLDLLRFNLRLKLYLIGLIAGRGDL